MKMWSLVLAILFAFPALSQEQMALRLNEQGIMKILKMAVQYNSASKGGKTVVIPQNIYKFTIPKSQLMSNPVVPVLNEISDINLNKDLDFYLNTSDIKLNGDVDQNSIGLKIFNSNENGFDVRLTIALPKVSAIASNLSLCEDRLKNVIKCGNGLKATLSQLQINTVGKPVVISLVLRLKTENQVARVSVLSVDSNLEGKGAPGVNINFKSIDVPKISIVIDGQETELDTSKLKDEILKRKAFLGAKLLSFAADFIASDLAEMLNVYLVKKEIATSYEVFHINNQMKFDEFLSTPHAEKGFYQRPEISSESQNPVQAMLAQLSDIIKNAQVNISLKKISTPQDKDIELAGLLNFVLNNRQIDVKSTLGNSNRTLPKLVLDQQRNYDLNLAISEPLINAALDLANSTGLFQEVFEKMAPMNGVNINSLKLHFANSGALVGIVNLAIDLNKVDTEDFKSWVKTKLGAWIEKDNNNSVIYFPIEVSIIPVFKKTPNGMELHATILDPFLGGALNNRFNYPSNVPAMNSTVKEAVMDKLKGSLKQYTNKTYNVNIEKFLNQSGVVFQPKVIGINQAAYLMISLDIVDIKFDSKNPLN